MKRFSFSLYRTLLPAAFGVGTALLAGCSATTPSFNPPQMQQPPLQTRSGSNSGARANSSTEAKLPPLERVTPPQALFTVLPYLQWGSGEGSAGTDTLTLCWQTPGNASAAKPDNWSVEVRNGVPTFQKSTARLTVRPLAIPGAGPQTLWTATVPNLPFATTVDYRLLQDGKPVFAARTRTRRGNVEGKQKIVVFGDTGAGTSWQKKVAFQVYQQNPDYIVNTGDVVYDRGRASEYLTNFFPIYNADKADAKTGAPLLRSTIMMASPGNHDLDYNNMSKWPDALAYFYYFNLPRNGPELKAGESNSAKVVGSDAAEKAMREAAGDAYPRMASYSLDAGNVHWTILDSNYYTNWKNQELQEWLEKDLASAQKAAWRFVVFHVAPFHSSKKHQEEQWMRVIAPILEKHKVDLVFNGHVHNYQRTYPMNFLPEGNPDAQGKVNGEWKMERAFDGERNTIASAPIYIVTGAGGAALYDAALENKPESWEPFTQKYVATVHSFSVVEIDGNKLTLRQIGETGKELDRFTLTH